MEKSTPAMKKGIDARTNNCSPVVSRLHDEMAIIMVMEYAIATPSTNTQRRVSRSAVHSGRVLSSFAITHLLHGEC